MDHPRAPEPIVITIFRARNIRGLKGDVVNLNVKVELWEKVLGESPKVECSLDQPAEFNYNTTFNCSFDDPSLLDELSYRPVILTLMEFLPKEKKQKEEKTQELGQCTFDLLPLIRGEHKKQYTLHVNPSPGSPLENLPADSVQPEIDVQISVENPLVTENTLKESNLLGITVESIFSPPDAFSPSGPQGGYTAAIPMPFSGERDTTLVFPAGNVKLAADKEQGSKQKRWIAPGSAQGNAGFIPESFISSDSIEDEDGDFRGKEDADHRHIAESEKNRVQWNMERRVYMQSSAVKTLKDKIAKTRVWPVEVFRLAAATAAKGAKKDEDASLSFHGVAYVNLSPLLYPGVKRIRGAYRVVPYIESEYAEKTKRRTGISEEASRIANGIVNRNSASPLNKKGVEKAATEKKGGEKRSGKAGVDGSDVVDAPVNAEGQQYADAKSYVMLEICLDRPLVPKKDAELMSKYVAQYIPPRPLYPKRTNSAEKAVEDYHSQVSEIASRILEEFREMFNEQIQTGEIPSTPEAVEQMRQELLYELNSSGKYFAFKEQLKYAVIKIVREKYLQTTSFADQEQLQMFLRDLFVYLVDELQTGLSRVITLTERTPVPPPITTSEQLLHFAREAEVNENHEWASRYYQERIARDRNRPAHWFDYATYCLGNGNVVKAEECFRECIAIDQKHINGLIMYGIVCFLQERHEEAETFLEAAVTHDPKNVVAWTVLGLFYDSLSNDIGAEMALAEANKLNMAETMAQLPQEIGETASMEAADSLKALDSALGAEGVVESAAEEAQAEVPPTSEQVSPVLPPPGAPGSRQSSAHGSDRVQGTSSKKSTQKRSQAAASRGGGKLSQTPGAQVEDASGGEHMKKEVLLRPERSIYMRTSLFLIDMKATSFTERALGHELVHLASVGGTTTSGGQQTGTESTLGGGGTTAAPTPAAGMHAMTPGPEYHLAHARFRLQTREFELAEQSLTEALQQDVECTEAWSHLGHLKYLVGDVAAAKDCFERTLAFVNPPSDRHPILLRLASIYLQESRYQDAKNTFLVACKNSPSCISWLGVGIACYRLDELTEAEDALSEANILNNRDPEVWGYLSLLCLKTQRKIEAEQSYKYALKVGLSDESLLDEIKETQRSVGFGDPQF